MIFSYYSHRNEVLMHQYTFGIFFLLFFGAICISFFRPESTDFFRLIPLSMLFAIYSIYYKMKPAA